MVEADIIIDASSLSGECKGQGIQITADTQGILIHIWPDICVCVYIYIMIG